VAALRVADLDATRAYLLRAGHAPRVASNGSLVLPMPASLGAVAAFHEGQGAPWTPQP